MNFTPTQSKSNLKARAVRCVHTLSSLNVERGSIQDFVWEDGKGGLWNKMCVRKWDNEVVFWHPKQC